LERKKCSQRFKFGSSKEVEAKETIKLPVKIALENNKDKERLINIEAYIIKDENIPLLCGKDVMNQWESVIDMKNEKISIFSDNEKVEIKTKNTKGGHLVIKLAENKIVEGEKETKTAKPNIPKEDVKNKESNKDAIGAYWLMAEKSECFNKDATVFVVEIPVKHHRHPDILEAKQTELKNLRDFDTFEEVKDTGQTVVGS
jgi:hypothetical protein